MTNAEYNPKARIEAVEWNRHERRLVVIGGIVLAHDGDEDLNLPALEACVAYAKNVASNAPLTVKAAKAAINAWERGSRNDEVDAVRAMVDACFNREDYREGRKAFASKRTPAFKNR